MRAKARIVEVLPTFSCPTTINFTRKIASEPIERERKGDEGRRERKKEKKVVEGTGSHLAEVFDESVFASFDNFSRKTNKLTPIDREVIEKWKMT